MSTKITTPAPEPKVTLARVVDAVLHLVEFEKGSRDLPAYLSTVHAGVNVEHFGVRATAKAAKVSAANVTRYAAAGLLHSTLAGLKGTRPAIATPEWCLKMARSDRSGIGADGIKAALAEGHESASELVKALTRAADARNGAKAAKAADDAEGDKAGTARPDDGSEPVVEATPWQGAALAVADALRMVKAAAKVTPEPTDKADVAALAKVRKAADTLARECDTVLARIGASLPSTVPTPAEIASNVGARA